MSYRRIVCVGSGVRYPHDDLGDVWDLMNATSASVVSSACACHGPQSYPRRPGEQSCTFFLKTGTCKYKMSCK